MRIKTNISSMNAARNQGINQSSLSKSLEKLSSGYRINRAGDDAAGLAISENMRRQIYGVNQAIRNCDDGIGLVNTGEGALTEVHSMLQRMQTLALQSANGTFNSTARGNIDAERAQLLQEIDRIGESCNFNDIDLFDSSTPPSTTPPTLSEMIQLQIGCTDAETMDVEKYYMGSEALGLKDISFTTLSDANGAVGNIKTAIEAVSEIRSSFGSVYNHLEHTHNSLSVYHENLQASESAIRDTNMASEITSFTKDNVVMQAAQSMLAQANTIPQMVMDLLR